VVAAVSNTFCASAVSSPELAGTLHLANQTSSTPTSTASWPPSSPPPAVRPTTKPRQKLAPDFGATDIVEVGPNSVEEVRALTDGLGVEVAIEAVGYPETLLSAAAMVRPGGTVANVGVHGVPVELPMQEMWIQNITVTMGLVDTVSIPTLLKMVASGKIPAEKMGTHTFSFDQMDEAYDVFKNAADNLALKVVIQPA